MRPLALAALAAVVVLAACATPGTTAAPAPGPAAAPAPHVLVATLQRGPCFGACPVYEVRLYADGVVEWNGVRFVGVPGQARAVVPPARVAEVRAALAEAGFSALRPRYEQAGLADEAWVQVSDGAKSVRRSTTPEAAPPALLRLEAALDRLLGTAAWVGSATLDR